MNIDAGTVSVIVAFGLGFVLGVATALAYVYRFARTTWQFLGRIFFRT